MLSLTSWATALRSLHSLLRRSGKTALVWSLVIVNLQLHTFSTMSRCTPKLDRSVLTTRGENFAIRPPGNVEDNIRMTSVDLLRLSRRRIPDTHGVVVASRSHE